jgi:hypothetical protein
VPTTDAESLGELIDDCTAIPADLRPTDRALVLPNAAAAWSVTDAHLAQVTDLDEYV